MATGVNNADFDPELTENKMVQKTHITQKKSNKMVQETDVHYGTIPDTGKKKRHWPGGVHCSTYIKVNCCTSKLILYLIVSYRIS